MAEQNILSADQSVLEQILLMNMKKIRKDLNTYLRALRI